MPKAKHWYLRMHTKDVLADEGLAACSLEARGAWWWLLMRMHTNGATGVWEGSMKQLALQVSSVGHDIADIVGEWRENGIGEFTDLEDGRLRIVNRRMARDSEKRESDRKRKSFRSHSAPIPSPIQTQSKPLVTSDSLLLTNSSSAGRKEKNFDETALDLFTRMTGYEPPLLFGERINHVVKRVDLWEAVIQQWMDSDYRVQNVNGILDLYRAESQPKGAAATKDNKQPAVNLAKIAALAGK